MDKSKPRITVRVYGILIEKNNVLVSDEIHYNRLITKFPGGGLQFGEGTLECLTREFREEMDIGLTSAEHYYTVDFFQASAFDPEVQVVSIYYQVKTDSSHLIPVSNNLLSIENSNGNNQSLRWVSLNELKNDTFTFPIDRHVAKMLTSKINH